MDGILPDTLLLQMKSLCSVNGICVKIGYMAHIRICLKSLNFQTSETISQMPFFFHLTTLSFLLVGYGTFTVSLSMYKDNTFTAQQSIFPAAVKLDQRLYFEVRVGTNDTNLVLLIEKCAATPTTNRNHASSYDLIKDR